MGKYAARKSRLPVREDRECSLAGMIVPATVRRPIPYPPVMNRHLTAALSLFVIHFSASAKELEGVYKPAQDQCPSVEEAIKKMKVPDGYEVRNFASEPMIINPVAMTWDHRGRLWVVELYEYPSGAKTPNEYSKIASDEKFRPVVKTDADSPRDRVIILEDTDNDGKADKRTIFLEGLNLATAILCGYDGVFVGQAPNLFFFRDTNGDDKADEYKTVLTGFGLEDRHELLNSFTWGPDGWLYMTHGVFTHSKVRRPEQKPEEGFTLTAGVFRVKITADRTDPSHPTNPRAANYEVYADGTSNPWGVDFDARGNAFVSACVIDHLFHMAPGGIYARQGGAPENPYAYELLPSIVDFKHFRAAYAGIQIYQGGIYPADTHGHLFIGNIHDNAIHEESLTPVGATFKAAPVRDFLRANDGWFRPVSTQTGPDGFLWVMDWCDKYPCYQNAQANPEGVDRAHGRIWRVCFTGSEEGKKLAGMSRGEKEMNLKELKNFQGENLFGSSNNWVARQVARTLLERNDSDDPSLISGTLSTDPPHIPQPPPELRKEMELRRKIARQRVLPVLSALPLSPNLSAALMRNLPGDEDAVIRCLTAKLIGERPDVAVSSWIAPAGPGQKGDGKKIMVQGFPSLVKLAGDKDPTVRQAVAVAVRQILDLRLCVDQFDGALPEYKKRQSAFDSEWTIIGPLISASAADADRTLSFAIWQAMEPFLATSTEHGLSAFADLALKTKPLSQVLTYKTARRITDTRSAENMDLLLGFLDKIKADDVLTAHALDGMLKAQEAGALKPAKADPAPFFARWAASKSADVRNHAGRLATLWGDKAAVTALIKVAEDPKADPARRSEAIRTLRKLDSDEARAALLRLLEQSLPK